MAYIKHGTGPNDYKKGNRTRGADRKNKRGNPNPDTTGLIEANKSREDRAAHYKEIARQQEKVIRYGQPFARTLLDNLSDYITEQRNNRRPLTIAGMVRASGLGEHTYYRYKRGEADHLLYAYMDDNDISLDMEGQEITTESGEQVLLVRLSQIIKNAELAIQEQLEENCYTNKGNPAGSIFGLKARYDWQDQPQETRTTNNNTLVLNNVASLDEAKEALKRLNG